MTQSPLQRYWPLFSVAATVAILVAAGVFIVATLPPRTIVMATGPEGGTNYQLGDRYREFLAKSGIELKLMPTAGSLENLKLLRDSKSGVSVALVQGGAASGVESSGVESLGTVGYEPLWLFHRGDVGGNLRALAGRRVSIGPEGSGARAFALDVLKRTKTEGTIGELLGYSPQAAAEKLIAGDIDAAFIVTGWDSPAVQALINAKGVELASFPRADAMVALYPFLTKLSVPRGIFDISADLPPSDVVLLASKSILAVRANLHPALQYLLLAAATEIHSQSGIFQKAGQFPIAESSRSAVERRSRALSEIRPALLARTAAVLVRSAHRKSAFSFGSHGGGSIPNNQVSSNDVQLVHEFKDSTVLWGNEIGREYNGGPCSTTRCARHDS